MASISGYGIVEKIYESQSSLVYRGLRESDGRSIVIKMLEDAYPSIEKIAWLRREYEIIRSLSSVEGVIQALGVDHDQNRWFMVLDDIGSESLARLIRRRRFEVDDVLSFLPSIVETLGRIHQKRVVHKDINPANILFHRASGRVQIIDFGISTVLSREEAVLRDPGRLEGTLVYMSPEQTGRANRSVDCRTDLYSLGVTLYELLTGRLPFAGPDPLEIVHAQLARRPAAPCELDERIDAALSDIVMKLLAKNPEDRYQSALGLLTDIEEYRQRRAKGPVAAFPLGRTDFTDEIRIPQKLYGREREVNLLLGAFDRVAAGAGEMMLVSGYPGIGKTALVREIFRPLTRRRGYFVSGKFDQLQRDVPYASLLQAFRSLVTQLLSESEPRIAEWRGKLVAALGANGRLITDVIPEVETVIGPQPPVATLEPIEEQNRFHGVVESFVGVFTGREQPLVLFIDDLQWADSASLDLLCALMTGSNHHLFVVGAYRDNEVSDTHPLTLAVSRLRREDVVVHDIALQPLDVENVTHLISETLGRDPGITRPLAELVHFKTGGNPFFLIEFLKHLHAEGLVRFDAGRRAWDWSLSQIEACDVTDNVVVLMAGKVKKLGQATQEVLKIAACTGNVFDLRTLALLSERSQQDTATSLRSALDEGLVVPLGEAYKLTELVVDGLLEGLSVRYRFAHDRIQQAAYSLIADEERRRVHWKLGKLLLQNTPAAELGQRIFYIVNQLGHALDIVSDPAERLGLARLHLLAGRKARASAAYGPALRYLQLGIQLLVPAGAAAGSVLPSVADVTPAWESSYRLGLDLFDEAADAACLCGEHEDVRRLVEIIRTLARSVEDRVRSYKVEIQSYAARDRLTEGVEAGRHALEPLGIAIPASPDMGVIGQVAGEAAAAWAGLEIEGLAALPEMTDSARLAAMDIMARLYIPAFNGAPGVFVLVVFHEVLLSLRYGVAPSSARGFVAYGFILCTQGYVEAGYRFGELALRLVDRFGGRDRASVAFMFNFFVRHWRDGLRDTIPPFLDAYQIALESGDLEFAGLSLIGITCQSFWAGKALADVAADGARYSRTIRHLKQELPQETNDIFWQTTLNLLGRSQDPCVLTGEALNEPEKLKFYVETNNVTEMAFFHLNKLLLHYLFGDTHQAASHAREVEKNLPGMTAMMGTAVFHFYDALTFLALHPELDEAERQGALARADADLARLRAFAANAPRNFEHKACLVAAERARVVGETGAARELYDRAIALAEESQFLHEEALSYELAARFHRDHGHTHVARNYLRDARYAYERWGAVAKVRQLEERFPRELGRAAPRLPGTSSTVETTPSSFVGERSDLGSALDLLSVLKASQALSGEIVLDKLLAKLLSTVIESAGAQKAILLLNEDGELVIEAEGSVDAPAPRLLHAQPMASSEALMPAVVNLVARRGTPEVLVDASAEGMFVDEPYVRRHGSRSILCAPLLNRGQLTGILYLENNLVAGAFTHQRLEVIKLLSAEMAIAIDNARLYRKLEAANSALSTHSRDLEDKVAERTRELAEKHRQVQAALEQLRDTQEQLILREKMASLGMLTAGIAHEMRNPFNLINNLAEMSAQMATEITEEVTAWSQAPEPARLEYTMELLRELAGNAASIEQHGKRATEILNSMLLHSQVSGGNRVATDVNDLMTGSIALAREGFRTRFPAFELEIVASCDPAIEPILIVPQEIGRVFINIVENACHATWQKKRASGPSYVPKVWVSTTLRGRDVQIRIRDNGTGIAEEHIGKIFAPFFTTKPPGEGTGLGLSVSYELVVHKHRGQLQVDARDGGYTEFIVTLPAA